MNPAAAKELQDRLGRDFQQRTDRPVLTRDIPRQGSDGWRTPGGKAITFHGVIGWTRPPQQDGAPYEAYYSAEERQYWVHQKSVLGSTEYWFGPFSLR